MEVCPLRLRISWSFFPGLFTEIILSEKFTWNSYHLLALQGLPARGTAFIMEFNSSTINVIEQFKANQDASKNG